MSVGKPIFRWILVLVITSWIVYFLPPKGFDNGKFLLSIVAGLGIALAGVWQFRVLKQSPEHPMKAVGAGAAVRGAVVIGSIVAAKFLLSSDQLTGTAIAVMIVYFVVQLAEIPALLKIVENSNR